MEKNRRDEALDELRRYQSVSHSQDYIEIMRDINEKYDMDISEG